MPQWPESAGGRHPRGPAVGVGGRRPSSGRPTVTRVWIVLAFMVDGFLVGRAVGEPFVVNFDGPGSYGDDWADPAR